MWKENCRRAAKLFLFYFKIGLFTFGGGSSIVAQMQKEFVEKEKDGLIASAEKLLNQGDADNFDWFCWLMHLKYMTMWREAKG